MTALGAVGSMAKFGEMNALAAAGSNYQALVCIFLLGGNDGHNTVVPITTAQQNYSLYAQGRGGLAIPQDLCCRSPTAATPTACIPAWWRFKASTTRAKPLCWRTSACWFSPSPAPSICTNNSALIPSALFSHSDQSSQWQTGIPSGTGSSGWGGRITDLLQSQNSAGDLSARDGDQQLPVVLHRRANLSGHCSPPTGMADR